MAVTSAIVMFAVIWWLALLCILPFNTRSQGEAGEVTPGTPASAPVHPRIGRTMIWTTLISVVLWSILFFGMQATGLSLRDLADPPDYSQPRGPWGGAASGEAPAGR